MKLEKINGMNKLIPSDNKKFLIKKEELDKPVEERYYFQVAYLPLDKTIKYCEDLYEEVEFPTLEEA